MSSMNLVLVIIASVVGLAGAFEAGGMARMVGRQLMWVRRPAGRIAAVALLAVSVVASAFYLGRPSPEARCETKGAPHDGAC
jgi:hypothetical protein